MVETYQNEIKARKSHILLKKLKTDKTMNVKLTKSEVARIAQSLTTYKNAHPETQTPMRDAYESFVPANMKMRDKELQEKLLRVARYLGWNACKRNGCVYENGLQIWSISGN